MVGRSWPGESRRGDTWIFCLTAARMKRDRSQQPELGTQMPVKMPSTASVFQRNQISGVAGIWRSGCTAHFVVRCICGRSSAGWPNTEGSFWGIQRRQTDLRCSELPTAGARSESSPRRPHGVRSRYRHPASVVATCRFKLFMAAPRGGLSLPAERQTQLVGGVDIGTIFLSRPGRKGQPPTLVGGWRTRFLSRIAG